MKPETDNELRIFEAQVRERTAFTDALIARLQDKHGWQREKATIFVQKAWAEIKEAKNGAEE